MRHQLAALFVAVSLLAPLPVTAQADGLFGSYCDMRATMDRLMSERRIVELLTAFGGADEMARQDMMAIEQQVRALYPENFANAATVLRQDMDNGFGQEMVAYWTGTSYVYARLLWHVRADGNVVALNMTFNSDQDAILSFF